MDATTRPTAFVHLTLSPEQRTEVKRSTGDSQALQFTIEELEQRIVPRIMTNANESLLVEPLEERVAPTIPTKLAGNANQTLLIEPLEERINPGVRLQNQNESLLIEPLEERIAPVAVDPRLASNHNETML
jgi:hypothetical protein